MQAMSYFCHDSFMFELYKVLMNTFLKSALLAISASFLGLTFSTHVRSQVRWNEADVTPLELQAFYKMPIGPKGLEVTDKVLQASGQKVRITGFMVKSESPTPGAFILTPRPVQMSEHADGDANDLPASMCLVYLDSSQKSWLVPHIPGPVTVEGLFTFKRSEAADGSVAWFHLQLAADAVSVVRFDDLSSVHGSQLQHSHSH
jgi:hypothetical protein